MEKEEAEPRAASAVRRHLARVPATALALAVCVLVLSGGIVFRLVHHFSLGLIEVLAWQAASAAPWLILGPVLLEAVEGRSPLSSARLSHHLALAILVAGANTLWFFAVSNRISPLLGAPETRYGVPRWFFLFWLVLNFAAYWGVIGAAAVARRDEAGSVPQSRDDRDAQGSSSRRILVEAGGETRLVSEHEIDWIEAQDYYAVVHVGERGYWVKRSLDQFERELDSGRFARIHRSTIVNVDRVARIGRDAEGQPYAALHSGVRRPFSQARWRAFRRSFAPKA